MDTLITGINEFKTFCHGNKFLNSGRSMSRNGKK